MNRFTSKILANKMYLLAIFISIITYYLFAYHTVRTHFYQVFVLYSVAFGAFLYLYKSTLEVKHLVYLGCFLRLIFLFAIPNLSDDFYRFLWDGRAIFNGINPYLILPKNNPQLIKDGIHLYQGMGSMNGSHFTCYPPLNQIAFTIPAIFSDSNLLISTIVMRSTLIISDVITAIFSLKILKKLQRSPRAVLLYFLNPFIIIELTGNLHYEGMMVAFLAVSIYYLIHQKQIYSALFFAFAVSIKLIPLLFLPVFIRKIGFKNTIIYGSIVLLINVLLFVPFANWELYYNFMSSIELYFKNFEFNASIYYIVREIGFYVKGYNIIQSVGKITPFIVIVSTLLFSFLRKNKENSIFINSLIFSITTYYLLSSIVHPWYVAVPLFLSIFSTLRFSLVWSFTIILSYSAYIHSNYQENLYLVVLEYLIAFSYLVYELKFKPKNYHQNPIITHP